MSDLTNNVLGHAAKPKTASRLANLGERYGATHTLDTLRVLNEEYPSGGATDFVWCNWGPQVKEVSITGTNFTAPMQVISFLPNKFEILDVEFVSGEEIRFKAKFLGNVTPNDYALEVYCPGTDTTQEIDIAVGLD